VRCLAPGIGVSTAVFTVINAVVQTETAQVNDRASNVGLNRSENGLREEIELSYSDYCYYRDHAISFRTVRAESSRFAFILSPLSSGKTTTEAEDMEGKFESSNFLSASQLGKVVVD